MWKNTRQVREDMRANFGIDLKEKNDIASRFFLISMILDGAILKSPLNQEHEIFSYVSTTPYFSQLINELIPELAREDLNLQNAVALKVMYLHESLIDFRKIDTEAILKRISESIIRRDLILPDRSGLALYKKFNGDFSDYARDRVSHLDHASTLKLLDSVEHGVYQVGEYVAGPFGIIKGFQRRLIPLVRSIPLWHCEDTGCNHLHHVELRSYSHEYLDYASRLTSAFTNKFGRPSEWQTPFALNCLPDGSVLTGSEHYDIPVFLAEVFDKNEISRIFARTLISEPRPKIQKFVQSTPLAGNWEGASTETIVNQTPVNGMVQLLSGLPVPDITNVLDASVFDRTIIVPLNEVRSVKRLPPRPHATDTSTSISALGLRADRDNPVTFMAEVIWRSYDELGALEDLEWRCRKASGTASLGTPVDFIRTNDPADVVRDLVLSSREVSARVAERLNITTPSYDDAEKLTERMLWKFGFTRPRYDDRLERIERQLVVFREEVLRSGDPMSEEDRERIREKGVNLFVNLEAFIEEIVSFNAWIFWSDHFIGTKFNYDRAVAIATVSKVIPDQKNSSGHHMSWKPEGGNTLGVLLSFANLLSQKIKELPTSNSDGLDRPKSDMPHYDDKARFVFRHTVAWADFNDIEMKAYAEQFGKLVSLLSRGKIDFVRNGLDHFRDQEQFPELETLTNFATFVEQAVQYATLHRLFPVALWLRSASQDEMGRKQFVLSDYKGREIKVFRPGLVVGLKSLSFGSPYAIPSTNLIGHANSELCFAISEQSAFSEMWKQYPIRQPWISKALEVPEASTSVVEIVVSE